VAYDLDSPRIITVLTVKIGGQEANLRGLETYSRGARGIRWLGLALLLGAGLSWLRDARTLAAWLLGYAILAMVTHYLFAPLLAHFARTTRGELDELRGLLDEAERRQEMDLI
jgi:hypothetical protein